MTGVGWYVVLHDVKLEDIGFSKMFSTLSTIPGGEVWSMAFEGFMHLKQCCHGFRLSVMSLKTSNLGVQLKTQF